MPARITWQETKRPGGASITFDGPAPSASRVWVGLCTLPTAAYLAYLSYYAPNPKPVTHEQWFRVAPFLLVIAGIVLVFSEYPGVHAGKLEIDAARIAIDPIPGWRLRIEVPVPQIDYVTADTEDAGDPGGTGRFRVRVMMRDGRRTTLAMFGESESALFMSQRLEALLDRARAFRVTG